jgi:uncharacterized RDD family membrane protein YckC
LKFPPGDLARATQMGGRQWRGFTRGHGVRLLKMLAVGSAFFVILLFAVQVILIFGKLAPDSSFYNFYPIMAGLGALFGFERWWAHEQGGVNPFHDR